MRIAIDGNIGAGKSELIAYLQAIFSSGDVDFYPEPTDEWHALFVSFMMNKKKYALPFTLEVLRQFGRVKHSLKKHQIVERHPLATMHVFNTILKNDRLLSPVDLDIADDYFSVFGWTPDVIIYLDVDDATCTDRVETRGREGEESLTYDDLRAISYNYEKMYKEAIPGVRVYKCMQAHTETKAQFHARIATLVNTLIF